MTHASAGSYSHGTQVCTSCTRTREAILECNDHVLYRLKPSRAVKFGDMARRLQQDQVQTLDPWCSVCPGLAEYECRTMKDWAAPRPGCGLQVCQACASDLTERFHHSLDDFMLETPWVPTSKRRLGLRADAELFRPGGLLWRRCREGVREMSSWGTISGE
ncbi:hypothetical protein K461DRAFT_277451 [Myriangium duriaei CBS 260.36]|uniref:Uncharacterized protein n=1 Tax=Myriangium duriaei CBS 260.36 TaxID=1168546 RepID=A0A9P4J8M1_9PEZI|nr:hypothetical protein K461DRAFT_277451 [Myriangium duriaei CBS 260.36]